MESIGASCVCGNSDALYRCVEWHGCVVCVRYSYTESHSGDSFWEYDFRSHCFIIIRYGAFFLMNKLIIANWKMNPETEKEAVRLARAEDRKNIVIAPPFLFISSVKRVLKKA